MTFRSLNATGYNAGTIFSGTIDIAQARPAHENNFAVRADDFDIHGGKLGGVSRADDFNGGINFFVASAAADRPKIG